MTEVRSVGTAMQVWVGLCGALLLSVLLRRWLGPLAQDPAYHRFADTREQHVTVGLSMACVFEWLRARRPVVAV
jgi:hypothetical protein